MKLHQCCDCVSSNVVLQPLSLQLSSFHDHKDDLRKRLSYTTHKLEMVEMEFDSTRQYLETELRRAQEELEKFTEKLRRCVRVWYFAVKFIVSSYPSQTPLQIQLFATSREATERI